MPKLTFHDTPYRNGKLKSGSFAVFPIQEEVYFGIDNKTTVKIYPQRGSAGTDFTATAEQTLFTVEYLVGAVDVYSDGVLVRASEYTAENGSTIVFTTPRTKGTWVRCVAY